jgi:hypothetical protein
MATGFYIAPFVIDGECEGVGFWETANLSSKWISICQEFLQHHGEVFEAPWSGRLSHITTRFTSTSGAALLTFKIRDRIVLSTALLAGQDLQKHAEVLQMFVDSLKRVHVVQAAASSPKPFEAVFSISERPLVVAVPFANEVVTEQDHELVRELELHLAAAFFIAQDETNRR